MTMQSAPTIDTMSKIATDPISIRHSSFKAFMEFALDQAVITMNSADKLPLTVYEIRESGTQRHIAAGDADNTLPLEFFEAVRRMYADDMPDMSVSVSLVAPFGILQRGEQKKAEAAGSFLTVLVETGEFAILHIHEILRNANGEKRLGDLVATAENTEIPSLLEVSLLYVPAKAALERPRPDAIESRPVR
jgi:hypothetical protein